MPTDAEYTIVDLARLTGLNVRTIRYYIAQGLIPASGEFGPGAHYRQGHLDRLRLTRRLQEQHQPLAEIRRRLEVMSDTEVASLIDQAGRAVQEAPPTSALEYVRELLGESKPILPAASSAPPAAPAPLRPRSMPIAVYSVEGASSGSAQLADQIAADLAAGAASPAPADATEPGAGRGVPERSQWERLSLGPNVEIHIRRPLSRREQKRVERLITIARQVLKEGQS